MTRAQITLEVDGNLAFARGWQVSARLKEAGCKPIYSAPRGAYMFDAKRLPDVLAYLESRNIGFVVADQNGGDAA